MYLLDVSWSVWPPFSSLKRIYYTSFCIQNILPS